MLVAVAVATAPASAGPAQTGVKVKDNVFRPDSATQLLDSSTLWYWRPSVEHKHNIRHDSRLFYSGAPTDDPKSNYSATISAGTWHYFCEVHGSRRGGMDGVIKVRPTFSKSVTPGAVNINWGDGTDTGDRFDVRYRVGKKDFERWHTNTALQSDAFGAGDSPVDLKPDKRYTFQARSKLSTDLERRSGWSPKLVVET